MKDKVALITGAASGIGRATAVAFAQKGVKVAMSDANEAGLKKTLDRVEKEGATGLILKTDISKAHEVEKMIDAVLEQFGGLDFACNNAGIGGTGAMTADYTSEQWDEVLNVNLRGQWLCMKFELLAMLTKGAGRIINISSILGKVGFKNAPAYVAAKHGLVGLTRAAAVEYATQNILVNAVCPAFIETPLLEKAGITTDDEVEKSIIALHPIGRMGTAEEVAHAVVWLASDEASFITGHTLMVDGGYTAQ